MNISMDQLLAKLLFKFKVSLRYLQSALLTLIWGPKGTINSSRLKLSKSVLRKLQYFNGVALYNISVGVLFGGRIFTDRISNVGLVLDKFLVEELSWQHSEGFFGQNKIFSFAPPIITTWPCSKSAQVTSLLTGGGGNYNIYHWLYDSLPRLQCISDAGCNPFAGLVLVPSLAFDFQKESLSCMGFQFSQLLSSELYSHVTSPSLWACSHPNPDDQNIPLWIIQFLRRSFLPYCQKPTSVGKRLYISRGDAVNARALRNECALLKSLFLGGFEIIRLSDYCFLEQVGMFENAEMIVAPHGAGLAHLAFCDSRAHVVELLSDVHCPQMYASIAHKLGLRYSSLIGSSAGFDGSPHERDFTISIQQIDFVIRQLGLDSVI